jgi:large subunit ribosomal protein L22e/Meckel syndrome type 1 protein
MNKLILAVALAAGCTLASSAPALAAAPRNYDCSKPGNANKAACKTAAKSATAAAAKATPSKAAPKPASTKVASTSTTKTVTTKNYDCSKAGNKNRAVCKSAAATPAKPVAKQTTVATTTRHYDCTKPGNANKQECKVSTATKQATSKPVAAPKTAAAAPRRTASVTPASVEDKNPAGAIAQCKDGTYSHSKVRSGACSRHGGVAKWS